MRKKFSIEKSEIPEISQNFKNQSKAHNQSTLSNNEENSRFYQENSEFDHQNSLKLPDLTIKSIKITPNSPQNNKKDNNQPELKNQP